MRPPLIIAVVAVVLAGCADVPKGPGPPAPSATSHNERALVWAGVVAKASRQPDFVGSERAADRLYLAYTKEPESNRAQITNLPDVQAVRAPYSRTQLDARLAKAVDVIRASKAPHIAIAPDIRSGDIVVTDVEDSTKIGPFYCDQLIRLPGAVPGSDIVIRDERTCVGRSADVEGAGRPRSRGPDAVA